MWRARAVPVFALLLLLGGCRSGGTEPVGVSASTGGSAPSRVTAPVGETEPADLVPGGPTGSAAEVALETVATLEEPLALAVRADDPALYVAEKTGRVVALRDGHDPEVVLDLSGEVSRGSEQGLLGIAFSPDGRFLYADLTDAGGNTHVVEFAVDDSGDIDPTERQVLHVAQPFPNHNGGNLAFGPDGYLYIALGDGGSGGDPNGNGQSLDTLLGKILRISPRPHGGDPYGIPADNPFVDVADARPEIWAFGLRNPWRFSFDRATGDLWIGDVGQDAWEEVDREPAGSGGGRNYGWNAFEGSHRFGGDLGTGEAVPPVFEYPHDGSTCVVTGGYVYRGRAIPALVGAYVFADFCEGRLLALRPRGGGQAEVVPLGPGVSSLASFGEDAGGELYLLSLSGEVDRLVPTGS